MNKIQQGFNWKKNVGGLGRSTTDYIAPKNTPESVNWRENVRNIRSSLVYKRWRINCWSF